MFNIENTALDCTKYISLFVFDGCFKKFADDEYKNSLN